VSRIRVARTSARFLSKISMYASYAIVNWPSKVDESGSFKPHMSWGDGQRIYCTLCMSHKDFVKDVLDRLGDLPFIVRKSSSARIVIPTVGLAGEQGMMPLRTIPARVLGSL